MLNKSWWEITEMDLNINGYEMDTEEANQFVKDFLYKRELNRVNNQYHVIDREVDLVLTEYFEDEIGEMTIIAERTTVAGPEAVVDKLKHWNFKAYCTIEQLNMSRWYEILIEKYSQYERDEFLLVLYVVGGIIKGRPVFNQNYEKYWRKRGIRIELLGFDTEGKMISMTDILIEALTQLKAEVCKIKNIGGAENPQEDHLLDIDAEGHDKFGQLYTSF